MRPSRESYARYLGTDMYPAQDGLFQAINAGAVVADRDGCWIESKGHQAVTLPKILDVHPVRMGARESWRKKIGGGTSNLGLDSSAAELAEPDDEEVPEDLARVSA